MSEAFKNLEAILTDLKSYTDNLSSHHISKGYLNDEVRSALEELSILGHETRRINRKLDKIIVGIKELKERYNQWEDRDPRHQSRSQGQKR